MNGSRGLLVLIGGDEKKSGPGNLLRRIAAESRAGAVSIIPSATRYPKEVSQKYVRAFRRLGLKDCHVLDIRSPKEADREEHLEKIETSEIIFFTGGDQVRLVKALLGTRLIEAVHRRYREGATIAGTSAGAAAASDPMIFDGHGRGLYKGRVRHGPGFGFLPGITMDTHFIRRHRITRLAQFLASGKSRRGIGLAENTNIFIYPDGIAACAGAGIVTVLSSDGAHFTDYQKKKQDRLISVDGLRLGFLSKGTRFDLRRWSVVSENK
jgi:cyanophycinase